MPVLLPPLQMPQQPQQQALPTALEMPAVAKQGTLAPFAQCGGRGGECGAAFKCADAAAQGLTCRDGYSCQRDNEW
jgi:hypothetical protein